MKKTNLFASGILLSGMVFTGLAGCGEDKKPPTPPPPSQGGNAGNTTSPPSTDNKAKWDPSKGTASVSGKVIYKGPEVKRVDLRDKMKEQCQVMHPDQPVLSEDVIVNDNQTLRHVFIYINKGLEQYTFDAPSTPVVLDQKACVYGPHVQGLQVNQKLIFRNTDTFSHNVKWTSKEHGNYNQTMGGAGDAPPEKPLNRRKDVMISFECSIHGTMKAYIGVLPHPFFQVTGENGSFELKGLPAGTYEVVAWHEKFGTKTHSVTLKDKETQTVEFEFKPD